MSRNSMGEQSAEGDAPNDACVCAEIAEVAGFRLSDATIRALCDRLRDAGDPSCR